MTVVDTEGTQDIHGKKRFVQNVPECDTDPINNEDLVRLKYFNDNLSTGNPTGTILIWVTDTPPSGYLICDGSAIDRTTYAALFAVIGTTFGIGDGVTTFNLPDLRGRVIIGQDDMGGVSANLVTDAQADVLGGTGGTETHTLIEAEIPAHTHTYLQYTSTMNVAAGVNAWFWRTATSVNTGSTGGDQPHNNMQPWMALNMVIKT